MRPEALGRPPRIGLAVLNHGIAGYGGGLDVYVRQFVEALAEHDQRTNYVLIMQAVHASHWADHAWPENFEVRPLHNVEPRQAWGVRARRAARRRLGRPVPPHYGEAYWIRQLEEMRLDLLHFPDTEIKPLSVTAPCLLTVFDIQHEYYPEFFNEAELKRRDEGYRASIAKAVHILTPTQFTRQSLRERYAVPDQKLSVAAAGIRQDLRPAAPDEVRRVRAKYDLPETYLFYPANPWPHKNHARLMRALRIHAERHGPPPTLALTGRLHGEARRASEFAAAAGVEPYVRDLGFVAAEDLPALYTGARLLVFPSLFEGFGLPVLEAMAYGCPVAAARATTLPECAGEAAEYFDPLDAEDIAQTIHRLLNDEAARAAMREKGFARVKAFNWAEIVPQITAIYERMAGQLRQTAA